MEEQGLLLVLNTGSILIRVCEFAKERTKRLQKAEESSKGSNRKKSVKNINKDGSLLGGMLGSVRKRKGM